MLLFGLIFFFFFLQVGPSVSLLYGYRFFFGAGPAWGLIVKFSLSYSSSVFNSFIRLISK